MFLMRIVRSLDFARDDRETPGDDRMNDSAGSGLKTSLTRSSGKKSAQPIAGKSYTASSLRILQGLTAAKVTGRSGAM